MLGEDQVLNGQGILGLGFIDGARDTTVASTFKPTTAGRKEENTQGESS